MCSQANWLRASTSASPTSGRAARSSSGSRNLLSRHDIDYEIEWRPAGEPFLTARGPLVETAREIVREECGIDPELSTGGGTSDGRFIALHGADVVEFGVINRTIHQVNERVRASDVEGLRRVYARIMERLLLDTED